jgi:hypothetical protein
MDGRYYVSFLVLVGVWYNLLCDGRVVQLSDLQIGQAHWPIATVEPLGQPIG